MLFVLAQFFLSASVIVTAGAFLTRFADRIAEITGWGRLFVGGLLLAAGTSLPELVVDVRSVQVDLPDLAVGDLLGSSLFNLLILAILDFSFPSKFRRTAFSPQNIHHSLSAVLTIFLTALVGIGIGSRLEVEFFGVNLFLWLVVGAYFFGLRLIYRDNLRAETDPIQLSDFIKKRSFLVSALGYFLSALVILFSAPYLVESADHLAKFSGLGYTLVGTVLVALATSLPELVSTIAAFRIGSPDLAIGNIFGSNAFNMILFFPLDFIYGPLLLTSVRIVHVTTALCVICAMSVALMGQLYRKKEGARFSEPSSEIIVGIILFFLYLLYSMRSL